MRLQYHHRPRHRRGIGWSRGVLLLLMALTMVAVELVAVPAKAAGALSAVMWKARATQAATAGNRYDWSFTPGTTGAVSEIRYGVPAGTSGANRFFTRNLSPNATASASTPALDPLTNGMVVTARIRPDNWVPGGTVPLAIAGKTNAWTFHLSQTGNLRFDFAGQFIGSSVVTPFTNGNDGWVRVSAVANGANTDVRFFTSTDGVTYTQLGATRSAAVTGWASNADPLEVGSFEKTSWNFRGRLYEVSTADVASGELLTNFDPDEASVSSLASWVASTGETWTLTRNAADDIADIEVELGVAEPKNIPAGGRARLKMIESTVRYTPPSAATLTAGTPVSIGFNGMTTSKSVGSSTSAVSTYNGTTLVDSGTSNALSFTEQLVDGVSPLPAVIGTGATATSVAITPVSLEAYGGNLYYGENFGHTIQRYNPGTGLVDRLVGTGYSTTAGDGGQGTAAAVNTPYATVHDAGGNMYFIDRSSHRVRRLATDGTVTNYAGTNAGFSGDGGQATAAQFNQPSSLTVNGSGEVFVADQANNRIRKIATDGVVTTIGGTGTAGYSGDGGQATSAALSAPRAMAFDPSGRLVFYDGGNHRFRRIDVDGTISTIAGTGGVGSTGDGGLATSATFTSGIFGIAIDSGGQIFIPDTWNNRVRRIGTDGVIQRIAGDGVSEAGFGGDGGPATSALLSNPFSVAVLASGDLYIADHGNRRVRRVDTSGNISTVIGVGLSGTYAGDGSNVSQIRMQRPDNAISDDNGNLFIADSSNYVVRKVDQFGMVSTILGTGQIGAGAEGLQGNQTRVNGVRGLAVDGSGNLYAMDFFNRKMRRVAPDGVVSLVGTLDADAYGGPLAHNGLLAFNPMDNTLVYGVDCSIQKMTLSGTRTILAGTPGSCGGITDGPASGTLLGNNLQVAISPRGEVIVGDRNNRRVVSISNGTVKTIAGGGASTTDDVRAVTADVRPTALSVDGAGSVWIIDNGRRVRRFTPGGVINTVAGGAAFASTDSGDGGAASVARFVFATALAPSLGHMHVLDNASNRLRRVTDGALRAPDVAADSVFVARDRSRTWSVTSNDFDVDGEIDLTTLDVSKNTAGTATHGTVAVGAVPGTIVYTPPSGFTGTDSVTYRVCDSTRVLCADATVTATVSSNEVLTLAGGVAEGDAADISFDPGRMTLFGRYLFVVDRSHYVIRRLDTYSGRIVTVAGNGITGAAQNGPANATMLSNALGGVAVQPDGSWWLMDYGNRALYRVSRSGVVSTAASAVEAYGVTVATDGSLLIGGRTQVLKYTSSAGVTTLAGSTTAGSTDGTYASALFANVTDVVQLANGDIYASDASNNNIRRLSGGNVTTVGPVTGPRMLAVAPDNSILIAGFDGNRVTRLTLPSTFATVLGAGASTDDGALASSVKTDQPLGVASESDGDFYWSETITRRVRKYDAASGTVSSITNVGRFTTDVTVGSTGRTTQLAMNTAIPTYNAGLAVDGSGNTYIGGSGARILRLDADGALTNYLGNGYAGTTQAAGTASLNSPVQGFSIDLSGRLVFADTLNRVIRRVNVDGSTTVLAGTMSTSGGSGDGGPATAATLSTPVSTAFDRDGNLYIADTTDQVIRKVDTAGNISKYAGTYDTTGGPFDGALATSAAFNSPTAVATDSVGNVYVADFYGNKVFMIDKNQRIFKIIGTGTCASTGDGGRATAAAICRPSSLAVDALGNLFVGESDGDRIRVVSPDGVASSIVGGSGFVDNATKSAARVDDVRALAVSGTNLLFYDAGSRRVRQVSTTATTTSSALAKSEWTVVPVSTGRPVKHHRHIVTVNAATATSKLEVRLNTADTGTPVLTEVYGFPTGTTLTFATNVLTLSFPSTTMQPGIKYGFAFNGVTGGASGFTIAETRLFDGAGTAVVGTGRSNTVRYNDGASGPGVTSPGYGRVWLQSSKMVNDGTAGYSISTSPLATTEATQTFGLSVTATTIDGSVQLRGSALTKSTAPVASFDKATSSTATGVSALPAGTWGVRVTTNHGNPYQGLAGGNWVGIQGPDQNLALQTVNGEVTSVTIGTRPDHLKPAGVYTSQLGWDWAGAY